MCRRLRLALAPYILVLTAATSDGLQTVAFSVRADHFEYKTRA